MPGGGAGRITRCGFLFFTPVQFSLALSCSSASLSDGESRMEWYCRPSARGLVGKFGARFMSVEGKKAAGGCGSCREGKRLENGLEIDQI